MPIAITGVPRRARAEIEPRAHVDRGHDAAAQIEDAGDLRRRQRHPRQAIRHEHILHAEDRQAEHLIADRHRDVFGASAAALSLAMAMVRLTPPE